jgi:putative endonuclease
MAKSETWYIYIVQCSDNSLYTGVTTDLTRRLHEHNHSAQAAKYTRQRRPVQLVYAEPADSRSSACKREHALKQLSVVQKRKLLGQCPVDINTFEKEPV